MLVLKMVNLNRSPELTYMNAGDRNAAVVTSSNATALLLLLCWTLLCVGVNGVRDAKPRHKPAESAKALESI